MVDILVTGVDNLNDSYEVRQNHPAHRANILASWADISKAKRLLGWEPQRETWSKG